MIVMKQELVSDKAVENYVKKEVAEDLDFKNAMMNKKRKRRNHRRH